MAKHTLDLLGVGPCPQRFSWQAEQIDIEESALAEARTVELPSEKMVELLELKIENLEKIDDTVQQKPPQTNRPRPKKKTFPKRSAKKKVRRPQEPTVHSVILPGCRSFRKLRRHMRKEHRKKVGASSVCVQCDRCFWIPREAKKRRSG